MEDNKKIATLGEVAKIIEERLGKIEMNDSWPILSLLMLGFQYKSVEEVEEFFDKVNNQCCCVTQNKES